MPYCRFYGLCLLVAGLFSVPTAASPLHPFDLESRVKLAIDAMKNCIDPDSGVPFLMCHLEPAGLRMDSPAGVLCGEYLDGLAMARLISGATRPSDLEERLRDVVLGKTERGIIWYGQATELAGQKHLLQGVLNLHRLYPSDPRPLKVVQEALASFNSMALKDKEDGAEFLYYPVPPSVERPGDYSFIGYFRDGWRDRTRIPLDTGSACFSGVVILPFAQYFELTQDPLAREYLEKFVHFLLRKAKDYDPDGGFTKNDETSGQAWSRMMTMEGILLYGLASGRNDLVEWARKAYDRNLELHGTRFGWFPESLSFIHGLGCETDTLTAITEIAFILARRVDDRYWNVAERIAMNQLLEQQLLDSEGLPEGSNSIVGGFASFCSPNQWVTPEGPYITQSSHGSGTRALYNVWYHSAWWEGDAACPTLRVNLHWSKNLPKALIISYLPSATTLEVSVQRRCHLQIRVPDWADQSAIKARLKSTHHLEGGELPMVFKGSWLVLGPVKSGSHVILSFPTSVIAREDTITSKRQGRDWLFHTQWRGNAVLSISPPGIQQPNYRNRDCAVPYFPKQTPQVSLDPVWMVPLERTGDVRNDRSKI